MIAYLLLCAQLLREGGEDTASQGNVASFDGDVSRSGEGFDDRQQRVGGEGGGFVGEGIDDLRAIGHQSRTLSCGAGTESRGAPDKALRFNGGLKRSRDVAR
ncbi:hypothetical protein D3C77_616350 [compost metagenome]